MLRRLHLDNRLMGGSGGGGSPPPPPPPPDPKATAAAQGGQDRQTAMTNAVLLNPNIVSPYGNISYDVPSYTIDGEVVKRPTQTTQLSPTQQDLLDKQNTVSKLLGSAGADLARELPNTRMVPPTTPTLPSSVDYSMVDKAAHLADFSTDADKAAKAYYDQQYALMSPDIEKSRADLENRLVQTGNPLGSEAYNTEMDRYQRNKDASLQNLANSSVSQGYNLQHQMFADANAARQNQIADAQLGYNTAKQIRGDQVAEAQMLRNQQINELSAILQGREAITLPVAGQYNQNALRAPDVAGMTNSNYQNQLQSYNQSMAQQQRSNDSFGSGLFSLGAAAMPLAGGFFGF